MVSGTLQSIDLTESVTGGKVWSRKKTMDLCVRENEEDEDGVCVGVNTIIMSDVMSDVLH